MLWGRAAGKCAWCNLDLLPSLPGGVLGEMAHIIGRRKSGPRGEEVTLSNDELNHYDNLILLCPTHHKMIDKDPEKYSSADLHKMKDDHESRRLAQEFGEIVSLFQYALKLLDENKSILDMWGPRSPAAIRNPASQVYDLWAIRKTARIIPNNNEIIKAFEKNLNLLSVDQNKIFVEFKNHAVAFEENTHERLDREAVPEFPLSFRNMLEQGGEYHDKSK